MNALTGMRTGEICAIDDVGETYRYSGSAWELIISSLVGIVWKDTQPEVLVLPNQSSGIAWTNLDLTAETSASASKAILQVHYKIDSYTDGTLRLELRKNGTTPALPVRIEIIPNATGSGIWQVVAVGLDSGEILQYALTLTGTAQVSLSLYLLGYIE